MRILHYTGVYAPAWSYGGPPRSVSSLCEGLASLGHEVTVYTTNAGLEKNPEIPTDRFVERNGVRVRYFASHFNFLGLRSPELEKTVSETAGAFDLIHVTGVWQPTSPAACRAAVAARRPYVCSPRGALGPYSFTQKPWKKWPYWWLWERANCRRAAAMHYTSKMEEEECARFRFPSPGFAVPNSINLDAWRPDVSGGAAWRQSIGAAENETIFLYAGRLHHKKGLDFLPSVMARLPKEKSWRLALVGFDEDGSGAGLREAFSALGIADRLHISGGVETSQLAAVYSGADAFVFPSRHENFGNVVIEALACGCSVVLSDQVGAASEVADFLPVTVLPLESDRWVAALNEVLAESRDAISIRPELEERFSLQGVARKVAAEYARIVAA